METTGLAVFLCTQYSALHTVGICNSKVQNKLALLEWGMPESLCPTSCFLLILFPVTECWSWLLWWANRPSYGNSHNSSSGKPFWTLPHHKTIALSFIYCALVSTSGLCPRSDSDEIRLMTFPGGSNQTTEHLSHSGLCISPLLISHDGTCARKAQCLPRRCENHKLCFSSLFFNVSNLGAQCVPWSKSGFTTFGWT